MKNTQKLQVVKDHLDQLDKDVKHQMSLGSSDLKTVIGSYNQEFIKVDSSIQEIPKNTIIKSETIFDDVECEWIYSPDAQVDHRILYIHGGSWCNSEIESYRPFAARVSKASGSCVLLVNYRVAPEHPFPAGLSDCLASYTKMLVAGPKGAGEATKTFIAGDSTGANMALALLFLLRERQILLPSAVVLLSPITNCDFIDKSSNSHAFYRHPVLQECFSKYLLQPSDKAKSLTSPVNGDLNGFPDMLIQVSELETIFDDVLAFVDKAKKSNVKVQLQTWADVPHGFQRFTPFLPQANEALNELGKFIKLYEEKKIIPFPKNSKKRSENVISN